MKKYLVFIFLFSSCSGLKQSTKAKSTRIEASTSVNEYRRRDQQRELTALIDRGEALKKVTFLKKVQNDKVRFWTKYFTQKDRARFQRYLSNGERFRSVIQDIFKKYDLPPELYYVGLIESGYYLRAKSSADAVGPWQFIKETAKRYGLKVNRQVDERRNIIKSTKAAARFFRDLYNIFGSWELALSAYNAGEYGIIRRIRDAGTRDYYVLSRNKKIPKETRHYVPKVLAAMSIVSNAKDYNIILPRRREALYQDTEVLLVKGRISLKLLSKKTKIPLLTLKKLNAGLNSSYTPYYKRGFSLIVPKSKLALAQKNLLASRNKKKKKKSSSRYIKYTVKKGNTLSSIARAYRLSISDIKALNHLSRSRIYRGQKLKLPFTSRTFYTVKKGDYLDKISKNYRLSRGKLRKLNSLSSSKIFPGQKLLVRID